MLNKPGFEQVEADKNTPQEMRVELDRLSHHDSMVANVFDAARYLGLSGEDKYVTLAYQAMIQLQMLKKAHFDDAMINIKPHVFFPANKP